MYEANSAYIIIEKNKIAKLEMQVAKEKAHQFYVCPSRICAQLLEMQWNIILHH